MGLLRTEDRGAVRHLVLDRADKRNAMNSELIAELSAVVPLMPGDIIFSGTPENVGPVVKGDVMQGSIAGMPTLDVKGV